MDETQTEGRTQEAEVVQDVTALVPVASAQQVQAATDALADTTDLMGMLRWGKVLAASGMFNDIQGAAQAIVKVLAGREKGLSPIESLTTIYVVQGRITYSAQAMAAFIKSSGRYNYRVNTLTEQLCEIEFTENGEPIGLSSFSIKDAERAGLLKGANWRAYPRNMLFARAISNGIKWFCPDLLAGGAYVHSELDNA